MFSIKKKLDNNLRIAIEKDRFKNYRIIIHCTALLDKFQSKIKSFRGELICIIPSINCVCANMSALSIHRLIEYPEVNFITLDDFAYLCANSVSAANSVNLGKSLKFTGKDVCIGLIDSGVYPHPDLLSPFKKIKKFTDLINGLNYPYDDNGHGTFISGILSGSGINSKGMYKGIAPNSSIYCIKAFNALGKGYISNILLAIDKFLLDCKKFNIRILCLPFEISTEDDFILSLFYKIFEKAKENDIVVIIPSGNNENIKSSIRGIAALSNCLTIGGVDTTSITKPYFYSASGPCGKLMKPDLSAACVDIYSLRSDINYVSERDGVKLYPHKMKQYYTTFTGTSCAAAYISGICALLLESNSTLNYKDVISLIKASCNLLNFPKWQQGEGLIDIKKLFNNE
ncbi:S8 family serine peptidase [Clostridium arbusti]|uniref:S8 family serine peptidase n=1 Tax=Clostridium arbusti TaxID=1137848 RepID=UPI000289DE11|nr:S8 family serine peptidase [Clostridium arbusti]